MTLCVTVSRAFDYNAQIRTFYIVKNVFAVQVNIAE